MSSQNNEIPEGFKMTELGLLPQEWQIASLADMAKLQGGYAFKSKEYVTNGIPVVRISNVQDGWLYLEDCVYWKSDYSAEVKNYELADGDILISMTGEIGRVAIVRKYHLPALLNQRVGRFRNINHQCLHPIYLFYYLQTFECRNNIITNAFGAIQANISANKILATKIPLPPLSEQKAIARVLSTIQKSIETQDKIIAAAKELKKSLIRHLFNYGPVSVAEAENVPLKETEIGPVPEHWDVVRLAELSELVQYGTSVLSDAPNSGIPTLRIPNVLSGIIDIHDLKFVDLPARVAGTLELKEGDLLFVRTNGQRQYVGRCAVFNNELPQAVFASYLIRVRLQPSSVLPEFVQGYTMIPKGQDQLSGKASYATGGRFNINSQTIKNVLIPLPNIAEQSDITRIIKVITNKIATEEKYRESLQALFKTMLHQLMTGKVRVKDLEAMAA